MRAGGQEDGWTGGRADRHRQKDMHIDTTKLIVAFRNFANWPKMAVHVFRKFMCMGH